MDTKHYSSVNSKMLTVKKLPRVSTITSIYRCMDYLEGYLSAIVKQTIFEESEFIIIHNDPTKDEFDLITAFSNRYSEQIRHFVVPRETLYASWNRGIREASADLLAIWNVDDLRTHDSLERQVRVLEEDIDVAFTYGDFVFVGCYGLTEGSYTSVPEFNRELFMRECLHGPFVAWRKDVASIAGLFDEQFKSSGDFDYWVRIAANYDMKKTPGGVSGYFLHMGKGLSTNGSSAPVEERNVIRLRYGIYDKIEFWNIRRANKCHVHEIFFDCTWHPVSRFIPQYQEFIAQREHLQKLAFRNNVYAQVHRINVNLRHCVKRLFHIKRALRWFLIHVGLYNSILLLRQRYKRK